MSLLSFALSLSALTQGEVMKIDIRSLVIGVLLTAVVCLALGARQPAESHSCGRYQVAAADYHAYVIDTATGKVWGKTTTGKGAFWESKDRPNQPKQNTQN
jgi:hypothetical protein